MLSNAPPIPTRTHLPIAAPPPFTPPGQGGGNGSFAEMLLQQASPPPVTPVNAANGPRDAEPEPTAGDEQVRADSLRRAGGQAAEPAQASTSASAPKSRAGVEPALTKTAPSPSPDLQPARDGRPPRKEALQDIGGKRDVDFDPKVDPGPAPEGQANAAAAAAAAAVIPRPAELARQIDLPNPAMPVQLQRQARTAAAAGTDLSPPAAPARGGTDPAGVGAQGQARAVGAQTTFVPLPNGDRTTPTDQIAMTPGQKLSVHVEPPKDPVSATDPLNLRVAQPLPAGDKVEARDHSPRDSRAARAAEGERRAEAAGRPATPAAGALDLAMPTTRINTDPRQASDRQPFNAESTLAGVSGFTQQLARVAAAPADLPVVAVHAPLHSPGFAPELSARVSLLAGQGVERAELQLNPADMGPVSVRIAVEGQQAQVSFHAAQPDTRHALEQSLPDLAAALRAGGLTLTGGGVFQQSAGSGGGGADPREAAALQRTSRIASTRIGFDIEAPAPRANAAPRRLGLLDTYV